MLRCYVFLSLIVSATCANSTHLSCKVDYQGKINFLVEVPKELRNNVFNISFYYWSRDVLSQEEDCVFNEGGTFYRCTMRKLTDEKQSYFTYSFSMIIFSHNLTRHTITNFTRSTNIHQTLSPWTTRPQPGYGSFTDCDDSFGTKLLAVNGPRRDISVEWVLYPLSVLYSMQWRATKLMVNSADIDYSTTFDLDEGACKKDMCSYLLNNVPSCATYKICIQTQFFKERFQIKCKVFKTYCAEGGLEWKDTLLMVFAGIVTLGIFGLLYERRKEGLCVNPERPIVHQAEIGKDEI